MLSAYLASAWPSALALRGEAPNNELLFQKTGSDLLQGCL